MDAQIPSIGKASIFNTYPDWLLQANPKQPFTAWYNTSPSTAGLKQPEDHSYAATYALA